MSERLDYQSGKDAARGGVTGWFFAGLGVGLTAGVAGIAVLGLVYESYSNGIGNTMSTMPRAVTIGARGAAIAIAVGVFLLAVWMHRLGRRGFLAGVILGLLLTLLPLGYCFVMLDKG